MNTQRLVLIMKLLADDQGFLLASSSSVLISHSFPSIYVLSQGCGSPVTHTALLLLQRLDSGRLSAYLSPEFSRLLAPPIFLPHWPKRVQALLTSQVKAERGGPPSVG